MRHDLSILQLRYTKAQFAATNPTPSSGQLCIETDSGVYTTGDGSSAYLTIRGNSDLSGLDRTSADDVYAMMSLGDSRDEVGDGSAEIIPFVIINSGDIKAAYRYYDENLTKPRYVQVIPGTTQAASAAASNYLFWGGDDKWHGWGNGGGEYFTSEDDVATPDLVTTWVLANGATAPLPNISIYPGPTVQDALEQGLVRVPIITDRTESGVGILDGLIILSGETLSGNVTFDLETLIPGITSAQYINASSTEGVPVFCTRNTNELDDFQVAVFGLDGNPIGNGYLIDVVIAYKL